MSIVWLLADDAAKASLSDWLVASKSQVFERARVWTLATSPLLEVDFIALLLNAVVLWMFVPTLERFWGTARFFRFVVITSLVGSLCGCLMSLALGTDAPIYGLSPF